MTNKPQTKTAQLAKLAADLPAEGVELDGDAGRLLLLAPGQAALRLPAGQAGTVGTAALWLVGQLEPLELALVAAKASAALRDGMTAQALA